MSINKMVLYALLMALLMIITIIIAVPIPGGMGYINLSDSFIMIISTVLKVGPAALIAGVGCLLADVALGFGQYAIYTFVVKALEAIVIIYCIKLFKNKWLAFGAGALMMLVGYGITDSILASSLSYFMVSVVANLPQAIGCLIVGSIMEPVFKKVFMKQHLN